MEGSRNTGATLAAIADASRRRGDLMSELCPSRGVLEHVTSRWGVLAQIVLLEGTHRFSQLRRRIGGVSEKMLAQTLQALEADGFVRREVFPVVPPRVDYSLTPMGREVARRVEALADWIERNMPRVQKARAAREQHAGPRRATETRTRSTRGG